MGAPPVPPAARTDAVLREFVARAVATGRASGHRAATAGYHHRNHVVPLTEPLAGLLGRAPGTLVLVRVPRPDAVPVVIRTWPSEPEILRAVRRVLPRVPECLAAGPGLARPTPLLGRGGGPRGGPRPTRRGAAGAPPGGRAPPRDPEPRR
ncbi:hypothetical protein ACWGKX_36045, partial [Streptomyces tricolor]